MPKNDQIWPVIGIFGLAGSFGALSVGWLVVVARGLYLASHLFTLWIYNTYDIMYIYIYGSLETILNKPFSLVHPTPGFVVHHSPDLPHLCRDVVGPYPCWYSG